MEQIDTSFRVNEQVSPVRKTQGKLCENKDPTEIENRVISEGAWFEGDKNGYGVLVQSNSERYEGIFKDGKFHGFGILYLSNGDKYTGDWINDMKHGKGIYIHFDG